jgi:hypothetical protein
MADKNVSVQVGPNFLGLLTIVFITLKLTGYITWSWWWVLAPLWGGAALFLAIVVIFLLVANIAGLFK